MFADLLTAFTVVLASVGIGAILEWLWLATHQGHK
jgi:hypothetical protein